MRLFSRLVETKNPPLGGLSVEVFGHFGRLKSRLFRIRQHFTGVTLLSHYFCVVLA